MDFTNGISAQGDIRADLALIGTLATIDTIAAHEISDVNAIVASSDAIALELFRRSMQVSLHNATEGQDVVMCIRICVASDPYAANTTFFSAGYRGHEAFLQCDAIGLDLHVWHASTLMVRALKPFEMYSVCMQASSNGAVLSLRHRERLEVYQMGDTPQNVNNTVLDIYIGSDALDVAFADLAVRGEAPETFVREYLANMESGANGVQMCVFANKLAASASITAKAHNARAGKTSLWIISILAGVTVCSVGGLMIVMRASQQLRTRAVDESVSGMEMSVMLFPDGEETEDDTVNVWSLPALPRERHTATVYNKLWGIPTSSRV